jgi:hypothetical protein
MQYRKITDISVKLLCGRGSANGARLTGKPVGKTLFGYNFDFGRGLPAIGLDQFAIVGHSALIAASIHQGEKQYGLSREFSEATAAIIPFPPRSLFVE